VGDWNDMKKDNLQVELPKAWRWPLSGINGL
jgi:hypothetical protein